MSLLRWAGVALLATAAAAHSAQRVELIVRDGLAVAALGIPVGSAIPGWAFTGVLEDGDGFIWRDGRLVWRNSDADRPQPVGAAPIMGVGMGGEFVFHTVVAGEGALWSHNGLLIRAGEQAPGFDPGVWLDFHQRATMTPGGTAFWVSGFQDGKGADGAGRVLYASPDAAPDDVQVVLRSDDLVEGIPIARPFGLSIEFSVSNDMTHLLHNVILDTGSQLDNEALYLDGAIVVREGDDAAPGIQWDRFLQVSVNNQGDYLFSAIASFDILTGSNQRRTVLAHNGEIQVREGQALDGVLLRRPASILGLDIDNSGRAVHLWSTAGFGPEHLFFSCDAARLETSHLILTAPARLTIRQPTGPDTTAKLRRFNNVGHGPVLHLGAEDGQLRIGAEVVLHEAGEPRLLDAIVSVDLPTCPSTESEESKSSSRVPPAAPLADAR